MKQNEKQVDSKGYEVNQPLKLMVADHIADDDRKLMNFAEFLGNIGMTVKDNKGGTGKNSFFIENI
jgi:hypothetical protein